MRKTFGILWAAAAERDLLGIVKYVAEDDPGAALGILDKIRVGAAGLSRSPRRGRVVPELLDQGIARYREIVIRPGG